MAEIIDILLNDCQDLLKTHEIQSLDAGLLKLGRDYVSSEELRELTRKSKVLNNVIRLCEVVSNPLKDEETRKELANVNIERIILVVCVLFANITACGEVDARWVFSLSDSMKNFQHIFAVAAKTSNAKAKVATMAALYNCLVKCGNSSDSNSAVSMFSSNRALLCQFLLSVQIGSFNGVITSATEINDEAMDWFHLFFHYLLKEGCIYQIFSIVKNNNHYDGELMWMNCISHEQIIVLRFMADVFDDYVRSEGRFYEQVVQRLSGCSGNDGITSLGDVELQASGFLLALSNFMISITEIFLKITNVIVEMLKEGKCVTYQAVEWIQIADLCLEVLSNGLLVIPSDKYLETNISLRCSLAAIGGVEDTAIHRCSRMLVNFTPSSRKGQPAEENTPLYWQNRMIKSILRYLGNLVYRCRVNQDMMRESGALIAVLPFCGVNFANPLEREFGLVCIRNACELNDENANTIAALKAQSVIEDEDTRKLREAGVSLEVSNGKVNVSRV